MLAPFATLHPNESNSCIFRFFTSIEETDVGIANQIRWNELMINRVNLGRKTRENERKR